MGKKEKKVPEAPTAETAPEMRRMDPRKMAMLGGAIKAMAPYIKEALAPMQTAGFCLFVFTTDGPELAYISDAQRADMIRVLKQFLANFSPPRR